MVDACGAFFGAHASLLVSRLHRVEVLTTVFKARASHSGKACLSSDPHSLMLRSENPASDVFVLLFTLHASTGNSWLMHAMRFSGLVHHFLKKLTIKAEYFGCQRQYVTGSRGQLEFPADLFGWD